MQSIFLAVVDKSEIKLKQIDDSLWKKALNCKKIGTKMLGSRSFCKKKLDSYNLKHSTWWRKTLEGETQKG